MVSLRGKANNDLWEAGWSQEEIDIVLLGIGDKIGIEWKGRIYIKHER